MTRKFRRIILWLFVALFIFSSAIIVFLAQGYRIDFRSLSVAKTGGIYIVTSVPDAKIYINDKYAETTSGLIKYGRLIENLLPRNYDVFIYREGFYPWNKTVAVKAGEVVEIKKIILFPIDLKTEKVVQADAKLLVKKFPKLATSTDGFRVRKTVLERLDAEQNKWLPIASNVNYLALSPDGGNMLFATASSGAPSTAVADGDEVKNYSVADKKSETVFSAGETIHYISWLNNSSYFITVSGSDLVITELDALGSKRNSIKLLFNIAFPLNYDADSDTLYFSRDNALYKTRLYTQ